MIETVSEYSQTTNCRAINYCGWVHRNRVSAHMVRKRKLGCGDSHKDMPNNQAVNTDKQDAPPVMWNLCNT